MPPRKKKSEMVVEDAPVVAPPLPKKKSGGPAAGIVVVAILLAVLVGGAVFLLSQPQGPATPPANQPQANQNANIPPVNQPTDEPADDPMAEGSAELVNIMDADGVMIKDQQIVWRRQGRSDLVLVQSVNALIPSLVANRQALYLFAKPTNSSRVFYGISCNGPCDAGLQKLISFDPKQKAFIPLLNAPDIQYSGEHLSSNQHRLVYLAGMDEDGEARELWVYDLVTDARQKLVTLPATESLTQSLLEMNDAPNMVVTWKDPSTVSYNVYRAGGTIPPSARPRRELATRTATIPPPSQP